MVRSMRLLVAIAVSLLVSVPVGQASTSAPIGAGEGGIVIRVKGDGWGAADHDTITAVLQSVANELMPRRPARLIAPIVVTHTEGSPVALYDRTSEGEFQVRLHVSGERWHLYVYEFAHEFCHLASNHDVHSADGTPRQNQWLEESLCEVSSLLALKRLAARWEESPADSALGRKARLLRQFYEYLIAEEHRRLPGNATVAEWLRDNEASLRDDPYQRKKNDAIAMLLLPLFERDPAHWQVLGYLNLDAGDSLSSLRDYLNHWYRHAPAEHRPIVADVVGLFEENGDAPIDGRVEYAKSGE